MFALMQSRCSSVLVIANVVDATCWNWNVAVGHIHLKVVLLKGIYTYEAM